MDRGYLDFERLYDLHQAAAFFVIRSKSNTDLRRLYSTPVDKDSGVRCDQIVALDGFYTQQGHDWGRPCFHVLNSSWSTAATRPALCNKQRPVERCKSLGVSALHTPQ